MVKKTKAVLKNDITTVIDDGGELTAAELRTILDDTVDSATFDDVRTDADIQGVVGTMVDGNTEENISVTYDSGNNKLNFSVPTPATVTPRTDAEIQGVVGGMVASNTETGITVSYDTTDNNLDFVVDVEYIQDAVGAMLSGNTETNITVTYDDVDGKINFDVPTQTSTGTGLTASQTRKLAEITERATAVFTAPANSGLIIDDNTGTAPANNATFLNPLTISAASTDEYYFRVEGGTSRDNLVIRRLSSTGTVLGTVDVSGAGATEVGAPDASFDWYVTAQPITVAVGDVLHLQVRSTVYDRYDLSTKVHTRAANVSNVARGSWIADDVQDAVFELQDAISDCCSVTQELTIPRRVVGRIITPTTPPVFTVGQQGMLDVSHVKAANESQEDIYKNPTDPTFVGRTQGGSRFWSFGFSAPLVGRTTPLLGLWYFFRSAPPNPALTDEASARALWTATGLDVTNLMALRIGKQHDPLDFDIGVREIYYPPIGEGPTDAAGNLGRAFLVILDNPVPPDGNRTYQMRFGSYDYPTLTLPGKVRLPSTSGTRTPADVTAGPSGATVEAALQDLNSRMPSTGSGLTASQTRKLGDITEVLSTAYATPPGAGLVYTNPANTAIIPGGAFAHPYVWTGSNGGNENMYFEVDAGTDISTARIQVYTSATTPVATGNPIVVSDAARQETSNSGKDRYLTSQHIFLGPGQSVRLETEQTTSTSFTLSDKYRIPATGVTGLPTSEKGDKGDQGVQGAYTVRIYTRSTSTPAPNNVVWVPASGATAARLTNTGSPVTWSLTVPGPGAGDLWEATATFDPASSATNITSWSPAFQAGSSGPAGDQGIQGAQGSYTVRLYRRSTSDVLRPTGLTWTASTGVLSGSGATGWSTDVPQGSGEPVWETNAIYDPAGSATTITSWGLPFRLTGATGASGTDGRNGQDGQNGQDGTNGNNGTDGNDGNDGAPGAQGSYTVRLYQRSTETVIRPTLLTWTASTGVLSGTHAVDWETTIPTGDDPVWETNAVFDPSGTATTITSWGLPFRVTGPQGEKGDQGDPGPAGTGSGALDASQTRKLAGITEDTTANTFTLGSNYRSDASRTTIRDRGPANYGNVRSQLDAYQDEFDRVENPILPDERRAENFLRPEGFSFSPSTDYRISGYSMNVGGTHPYVVPTTAFTSSIPTNITVPTAGVWIELSRVGSTNTLPANLEFEPNDVNVIITAGGNITPIGVRRIWRDTTVTSGVRSNRYAVVFRNMLRSIPSGGVLSVSLGRSDYARFPMSNKFRLPSESVTRTATALTSTTLEGALEELRTSSGGSLSALDTRKLAEITEANRADTFANEPLSGISVAANVGGNLTPRDISTSWPATFTGGTGASGERLFFEIDDDANLTNLFMRVLNEDGTVNMSLSVSDAVSQPNPNTGKLRYLASQTFNNPTNGTIRLQRRSAGTLGYTLSDNFIVPVSTLEGELKASDIVSAASGNLVATDVQAALNELQGDIDDQPGEAKAFFDHVELTGTLTNTSTASDFYYLPSASLPERDLTKWTHVTNSQFPQPTLTSSTPYVVLLNDDKYPNMITWAPASTQPNDPRTNASPANILASGFNQLDGLRLPEGYEGFEFIMPSWNAASTLLTGARLQVGDLARGDVRRVDLGAAVKVTDDNLDITNPNTTLTENQREKLQGLQVKTYDQAAATTGKPHADYKLMAATAWPDANVDYSTFDPITRPNLMQRPSYTGIRESRGGRSGLASFFNLVTDTPATFEQPVPNTRGYNVLYNQRYSTANEYADCAGVWGGTIKAEDTSSSSNFRVDDGRGLFATMTLHLPPELSNGSYPIMNIGNEDEDGNHALVLRKGIDNTYPPTTDLAVKRWEGPRTSTTSMQYVDETLEGAAGQTSQIYRAPFGATSINIPHTWIIPSAMAASSANPARLRMFVRVWDSGSDLGEHDFTSALPASFRSISDLTVNTPTNSAPGVVTDFTLDLFGAGFPGPLSVACNAKYIAADASEGGNRSLEIHFNSLNNPALYYEVRMEASSQQSVTIPAGRFREDVIAAGVPDGASEIGFYTYATGAAGSRKMNYRAAINGRSGDLELDDFTDANSRVPLGAVPVTFGHASSPPAIAVNRFAIFKPAGVLSVANMNELTTPSERNRPDVGGLVRHAGGEYKEVFSPSYKATMFTSGAAQNLPHVHPGSSASPATTNNATPVTINWTNDDTPPELSFVSGSTSELLANTNFTGNVTLDAGVQFDDSELQGNVNVQAKGFLLLRGQIQEKIGTGAWTRVPGPELYIEMRVQLYDNGVERPETSALGDPMLRRMFTTVVKFKAGAQYRVQATGFRLHGATSISGARVWPAGDSVVRLAANNTFLQILVTPTL